MHSLSAALGDTLMYEARCYVTLRYIQMGLNCPYQWESFNWYDADMLKQPDESTCGVMVMMFLKEWNGSETEMESFEAWTSNDREKLLRQTTHFRMYLCCSLVNYKKNCLRANIQRIANDFCKQREVNLEQIPLILEDQPEEKKRRKLDFQVFKTILFHFLRC
ncbi:hypothetical protein LIER_04565 [Lithospermum erythrorhizon]|uniref:Ubiquitin-like protease family profile domain-containing protein n=1 Tax=Lithospermum erythrorhizon TaxID=34254 RepID=A0AAV3NZ23_LITER